MKNSKNITHILLSSTILASLALTTSATQEPTSQPMTGCSPLDAREETSQPSLSWTAEENTIPVSGYTTDAVPPLDCNLLPDVFAVPEGTVYEYITDANGNFILVDDNGRPVPIDEEMTQIPRLEDMIYPINLELPDNPETFPRLYEDTGHEIQSAIGGDLLTEAFDPEGEPMPEGAFASPNLVSPEPEPTKTNWFTNFFSKFFSLFSK